MLSLSFADFFLKLFQKNLLETLSMSNGSDPDQDQIFVSKLFAKLISRQQKLPLARKEFKLFFPAYHQCQIVWIKSIPNVCQAFSGSKLFAGFIKLDFMLKVLKCVSEGLQQM